MDIKDVTLYFSDKGEISTIKANINGEDHLTGDTRTYDCKDGEVIGTFSNITLMDNDEFVEGWYNTIKECVRYGITKALIPTETELHDTRLNIVYFKFKYETTDKNQ